LYILGLTGGISSGKSEASKIFSELGYTVIETDKIAHEMYLKGTDIYEKVISFFGENILKKNNEIDRSKLGEIVFYDKKKLSFLQNLIWPEVIKIIEDKISVSKKNRERIFVIESHLIFESEIKNFMNEIWTIESSEPIQLERLVDYRGLSLDYAKQIISVQNDSSFRKKKSDKVIENTNELFMFRNKIIKLINKLENKLNSE
jgi:dephospho-CoA kinase